MLVPQPPRKALVTLDDGARVHVQIYGETLSGPPKPLLIALHGAPGLSNYAEPAFAFGFLATDFRVLVYDARGSGESDLIPPYTHERWVQDVENLRVWAGAETLVLAGGSYGGFLTLEYALRHPARLRAIVLRDTFAHGLPGSFRAFANILTSRVVDVDVERQIRVWSGALRDDADFEDGVKEILPIYAPPGKEEGVEGKGKGGMVGPKTRYHAETQNVAFGYNMPRYDVRARLGEIKVPTLVVVGRHDKIAPLEASEEIAGGIPGARLVVFEKSGHNPSIDEGERFREVVGGFLEDVVLGKGEGR